MAQGTRLKTGNYENRVLERAQGVYDIAQRRRSKAEGIRIKTIDLRQMRQTLGSGLKTKDLQIQDKEFKAGELLTGTKDGEINQFLSSLLESIH